MKCSIPTSAGTIIAEGDVNEIVTLMKGFDLTSKRITPQEDANRTLNPETLEQVRTTRSTWEAWKAKREHTRHQKNAKKTGELRHFNNWGKCAYYRKNAAGEWVFAAACNKLGHSHKHKHNKTSANGAGVNEKNGIDLRRLNFKIRQRIKATNNNKYGKVLHGSDGKGHCKLTRTVKGTHTKVYIGMCPTHKKK